MISILDIAKQCGLSYIQTSKKIAELEKKGDIKAVYVSPKNKKFYDKEDAEKMVKMFSAPKKKKRYIDTVDLEELIEDANTMTLQEMSQKYFLTTTQLCYYLKSLGIKKKRIVRYESLRGRKVNKCFEGEVVLKEDTIQKAKEELEQRFERPLLKVSIAESSVLIDNLPREG